MMNSNVMNYYVGDLQNNTQLLQIYEIEFILKIPSKKKKEFIIKIAIVKKLNLEGEI